MNEKYGTHREILKQYALISDGPIVEFGCGPNSTQMLHDICIDQDRLLISFETQPYWIDAFHDLECDNHKLHLIEDWTMASELIPEIKLGLVFIDHDPAPRRKIDIYIYSDVAQFIVVHDSNNPGYKFNEIFQTFKYVIQYNELNPSTAVLSNFSQPTIEI